MDVDKGALVITYAFLLGNVTLAKYFKSIESLPLNMRSKFRDSLEDTLKVVLNFDEPFAAWLPLNFHHLNDTSADLLESLDSKMFTAVRCSTVC